MLDAFLDWLAALPTVPTYLVLMLLSALENVFPPVPADVAVALGAFLARRGEASSVLLGVFCWLANTASSAGMYYLARLRGEAFFREGVGRRLMSPGVLKALEEAYARHGVLGIFLSRFLPGVRAAVTPFAGVVGMPPLKALVPAATASAIWYTFLIAVGSTLGLSWDGVRRFVDRTNRGLGLAALAATAALAYWLWTRGRPR